ncbi:MAG: DUF3226 domain-containing protein [Terriglobales bacterium]
MPPIKPFEITEEFLIVGEGAGDQAFFRHLCDVHGIGPVQVLDAGGTGKLEEFLKSLPTRTGFRKCKMLVVVGDNDDAPDERFKQIRIFLKRAKVLPVPENPFQVKYTTGDLKLVVIMLPFDDARNRTRGCLETLLIPSAFEHLPEIAKCIPAFGECIGVGRWPNGSHVDKFRLRALLAAAFPDNPNFGLQYALHPDRNVIPLDHQCFGPIVEFIRGLLPPVPAAGGDS